MSKGGGGTNTIEKADPWEGVSGFLAGSPEAGIQGLYGRAYDWLNSQGPQYFPGSTVAAPSAATLDAENQALYNARYGTPSLNQAKDYFSKAAYGGFLANDATAQGAFLNSNPYLSAMTDAATRDINRNFTSNVLPGVASQFALGGRYGSGAQQDVLGQVASDYTTKIGDITSDIYGKNYAMERGLMESAIGRERGFQQQAAQILPALSDEDWRNLSRMAAVGEARDERAQGLLNADINRWNFQQNLPLDKLNAFASILQGTAGLGGQRMSSTAGMPGASRLSGALGGGLAGYTIGAGIGTAAGWGGGAAAGAGAGAASGSWAGPIGAGIGALLGLLL